MELRSVQGYNLTMAASAWNLYCADQLGFVARPEPVAAKGRVQCGMDSFRLAPPMVRPSTRDTQQSSRYQMRDHARSWPTCGIAHRTELQNRIQIVPCSFGLATLELFRAA
jgi:hypothetical protein